MLSNTTLLENIIAESERMPPISPYGSIINLFYGGPWWEIGGAAVRLLKNKHEIVEFMDQFIDYIASTSF